MKDVLAPPCLTADLPGIGGMLKSSPDDFLVVEVPAYEPCGEGEHLFLWVQKRETSAEELLQHVSRTLQISPREIGTAGMKDRQAITRQFVSVPRAAVPAPDEIAAVLETDHIQVLRAVPHRNKLRTGHLRGNRFSILVRDVVPDAGPRAEAITAALTATVVPNYYGPQRFGQHGNTARQGLDLLSGKLSRRKLRGGRSASMMRLYLSAAQSALFNQVLADRIRDELITTVLAGDVLQVAATGGVFHAEDMAAEQRRLRNREIVLTGPMFGPKMKAALGEPGEREQRILTAAGLTLDHFNRYARLTSGARRPLIVHPRDFAITPEPEGLRFAFELPAGSYATVVLGEFLKSGG